MVLWTSLGGQTPALSFLQGVHPGLWAQHVLQGDALFAPQRLLPGPRGSSSTHIARTFRVRALASCRLLKAGAFVAVKVAISFLKVLIGTLRQRDCPGLALITQVAPDQQSLRGRGRQSPVRAQAHLGQGFRSRPPQGHKYHNTAATGRLWLPGAYERHVSTILSPLSVMPHRVHTPSLKILYC